MKFIDLANLQFAARSGFRLPFNERLQYGFQCYFSLSRTGLTALELNPAFVKAIKHFNTGCGVLHAFR